MKKLPIILLTFFIVLSNGCNKNTEPSTHLNIPGVPAGAEEKIFYAKLSKDWIAEKHELMQAIDLYKKLIQLYPKNDPARKDILKYIMDENLFMIIRDKKPEEGLKIALELDKIIPSDFYIQNRIIGAYRVMAEQAIEKKDYKTAEEILQKKALTIRFDTEAVRTLLKLRILQAQQSIKEKKKEEAKNYLKEALTITNMEDNDKFYTNEKKEIEEMLAKIQ